MGAVNGMALTDDGLTLYWAEEHRASWQKVKETETETEHFLPKKMKKK